MTTSGEDDDISDVIILGGGPAGTAAGLTLLQRPGIRVTLVEASSYETPRIGESLTPGVRPLLEYLGVWERFRREQTLTSFGSRSAWGSATPTSLDYLFTLHGTGWSLDRVGLDRLLADEFMTRGGCLRLHTRCVGCHRADSVWDVRLNVSGHTARRLRGRFLIDASGRSGRLARHLGIPRVAHDQLVGVARLATVPRGMTLESVVLVEACQYGWWYTAPIPGNQVSTVLMSDADLIRPLNATGVRGWETLLRDMPLTSARLDGVLFREKPRAFSAVSSCLRQVGGGGWVAIGDAAASHDPLSSTGIPHAMGSGTQGALVAANALFADGAALKAYQHAVHTDFLQYLRTHWRTYQRESRWPDSPFWQRRRTAIGIRPDARLEEIADHREITSRATVHLPPRLCGQLRESVRPGRSAHEIVNAFSRAHPDISDQRIILALQDLVTPRGASTASGVVDETVPASP